MFGIYTAPTSTFAKLREKPKWLVPLIIAAVATMAAAAVATQYVDWEEQRATAVERMEERGMTEEQMDEALERMEAFSTNPVMRYGLPVLGALVTYLVSMFFLSLVYNIALPLVGAPGNYMKTLSVVTHAGLVAVPAALVRIVLMLLRGSAEVSTSLLLAFPDVGSRFLGVVLGRIDLFTIWQVILVGLWLKVVFDVKGSRSYWLAAAVWLLITLVFGALALLGGR